ncbi:MAG: glycosyltransferase family 2 protein [Salinivirgaceae bacterium]|nr:glycosyltransferase family 2 protein [Salinivirgaceae bacterium]
MEHAPVCIVTLNRYDHFRKCLESLEQCTGASETEVFVALDYPPTGKYVEGWKQIDSYLFAKESDNGFKKLNVIRREHNCGVGKPDGNWELLLENNIQEHYDCYIFTEDDNVFSPNFLEFINKGLDKFENYASVSAIIGYCHPYPFKTGDDNFFFHNTDFSAWGYGVWTARQDKIIEDIKNGCLKKTFSLKNYVKVRRHGYNRLLAYLGLVLKPEKKYLWITDNVLTVYNIVNDMYVVVPSLSKVRNEGWDLLGLSFDKKNGDKILKRREQSAVRHNNQTIDKDIVFDYKGTGKKYCDYNNRVAVQFSDGRISYLSFVGKAVKMITKALIKRMIRR